MPDQSAPDRPAATRPIWPLTVAALGVVLQVATLVLYVVARFAQSAEQAKRDEHWREVQQAAAQSQPPVLPGEEKPADAPLPYRLAMVLLAAGGAACVVLGTKSWAESARRSAAGGAGRSPQPAPISPQ